jgi:hypothetical protein
MPAALSSPARADTLEEIACFRMAALKNVVI